MNSYIYIYRCFTCCSVAKLCPALWDTMDCSTPGFPVLHCLPEFAQTHVHWVGDAAISSSVVPFSSCHQSLPASESFPMSQLFITLQIETACFKTWRVMQSPLKNVMFSLERSLSIWNLLFRLLLLLTLTVKEVSWLVLCKSLYWH